MLPKKIFPEFKGHPSGYFKNAINRIGMALLVFLFLSLNFCTQKPAALPRSTPEAEGVSSLGLINFLNAVANSSHEFHSFMMLRHGKVIAEGWWHPYRSDLKHTMYSTSKSFTATAVGFAVAEKRLTVDDKVITFFPNELPDTVSTYLSDFKIRDLLSMSVGHQTDPTWPIAGNHDNWVKAFLRTPIVHQPGTKFLYNSAASYMLSAIVQKVTGERIADYLKPRLFDPLGIEGMDWETDPRGINTGGWGLRLKTEDMAKFGQLFLQKGSWQGQQILPAAWVEEATTLKIEQAPDAPQARKDSSDWLQGYCYQMWRCRNNAYRADGAYGQFIIIMPDQDAVVAITSETPDMQSEINLVWQHILPAIHANTLAENPEMLQQLKAKTASLALPIPGRGISSLESMVSGKTFNIVPDGSGLETIGFEFNEAICRLILKNDSAIYPLTFGAGKWESAETIKYGPYLVSGFRGNRLGLPPFKVAGCYTWSDAKTLEMTLRYIESPHTETIRCQFEGDQVLIGFKDSFNQSEIRKTYTGKLQ